MKAAVVERLGQTPVCAEIPEPAPEGDLVVATLRAAAVKNVERMLAAGTHYGSGRMALPLTMGTDAVVETPDGRRLYTGAVPPGGTMAERVLVDPGNAVELPDGVDDAPAAALPNAGVSAMFALEHSGRVRHGQNILVLGATGVTGALAVRLAKRRFGAGTVTAVGRDAARLDWLTTVGADETITLGDPPNLLRAVRRSHHERPFDLVLDYLWGEPAEQTLRALGGDDLAAGFHRTRFVQIGEMAGPTVTLPAGVLRGAGIELVGQGGGSVPREAFARLTRETLPELFSLLASGDLRLETVNRPLDQVSTAWAETPPSGTRLVLTP
ncbi:zinc-binding alcohol dehydrogenase family protein [Spiractinospora alimapuensis]|uniref:quinone oxidoreductase family protein n=1 Tax=Spiractinospora alimapuensis TaxID=2820884 RepID=UPI001F177F98|nr:zinc-binding alcohol dehydrogenase family protein [Spiractinospora alimapuensis]QVQ53747.1 zinc-binding alcohol dehydrogenase family protein [Spiractinospora alimapuensis]